jgi:hypothetical protein
MMSERFLLELLDGFHGDDETDQRKRRRAAKKANTGGRE